MSIKFTKFLLNSVVFEEIRNKIFCEKTIKFEKIKNEIIKLKKMEKVNKNLNENIIKCLQDISEMNLLRTNIEQYRAEKFDPTKNTHLELLSSVWENFIDDSDETFILDRKWKRLGFQRNDPTTDFRGMGLLGVRNLAFFVKKYPSLAKFALESSYDTESRSFYPFAATGFNITSFALDLLNNHTLDPHFYINGIQFIQFNEIYSKLFVEFNSIWIKENPKTILEFQKIYDKFKKKIQNDLNSKNSLDLLSKKKEISKTKKNQ
ncbi:hypothetical protein M0811_08522 [Anaeramoeba ignava]|uniref:ELMO domain-containing protein n=1 Tax=Anaeramoeba ignava TaxID=1746090 RepID=A0A9Q0LM70_ANAIG|nr:hypothetical protein M0811_08522 [Anaeramoeba ignava]